MFPLHRRLLALAVSTVLAATSLVVAALAAPPPPASATHLPNPSVECYLGGVDGWLLNTDIGATDDVYDRDALARGGLVPGPLYTSIDFTFFDRGVLGNDYTEFFDKRTPLSSSNYRAILWSAPDHAKTFELRSDGTFRYVPQDGYFGADSFQYVYAWATEGSPCSNVATVHIPAVDQIRAQNDTYTAYVDTPLEVGKFVCGFTCGVLDNDVLADRNSVVKTVSTRFPVVFYQREVGSFTSYPTDKGGTLTQVSSNGSFVYTPPAGFRGTDSFAYRAQGFSPTGLQLSLGPESDNYARVTLNVVDPPAPDVPKGAPDSVDVIEDTPITIAASDLLANDPNGTYITYVGGALYDGQYVVRTRHGELQIPWTGFIPGVPFNYITNSITYVPDPDFAGIDRFIYYVANNPIDGPATPVEVFLVVAPVPDAPVPNDDSATIPEDTVITIDAAANDYDGDGDLVAASLEKAPCQTPCDPVAVEQALHGDWAVNGDGTVTYTPDAEFVGEARFHYEIADALGQTGQASITVTVESDDAVDDEFAAVEDQTLAVAAPGVLENDDPPAATGTPLVTVEPEHGTVHLAADGSFSYEPESDFSGTDTFTYEAGGDQGVVTIDVAEVNDAPVLYLRPYCDSSVPLIICLGDYDDRDLVEGETAQLRGTVTDVEFDSGTFVVDWGDGTQTTGSYPCEGEDCAFTLEPTWTDWLCVGTDCGLGPLYFEFEHTYRDDPDGAGDYFPVSMTITEGDGTNGAASTSARVTNADPTLALASNCSAPQGSICLGNFSVLTGEPGDTFRIGGKVIDPGLEVGTITIDWGDGSEDTVLGLECATDSTCPTPSQQGFTCPSNVIAVPSCGYFAATHVYASGGDRTVTVVVDDGDGGITEQTALASVAYVNDAPSAADGSAETREDTPVEIDLAEFVDDAQTADADLLFELLDGEGDTPTSGSVELDGSVVTYTPAPDVNGEDGFGYRVTDRGEPDGCGEPGPDCAAPLSATRRIGLTVVPVNDEPTFTGGDDVEAIPDGLEVSIPNWATELSPGPADEAAQTIEFQLEVDDPSLFAVDGQPAVAPDGTLTFTPVNGGVAHVTAVAVDSGPGVAPDDDTSASFDFVITIDFPPVVTAPETVSGTYSDTLSFVVSATDPEDGSDGVTLEVDGLPAGLTANGDAGRTTISGVITAEPGIYPVDLHACDAHGACTDVTVEVVVDPEIAIVKIASSTPWVVPVDGTGSAPQIAFSAKITEDGDRSWGDLGLVEPADLTASLRSAATGVEANCAPQVVKTTAARGNAPGTLELACALPAGLPVGVYDLEVSIGGWFEGSSTAVLTVSGGSAATGSNSGSGTIALPGGGTGEFSFAIAASGRKGTDGSWRYVERAPDGTVVRTLVSTSITAFAVSGSGGSRTIEFAGKADVDGVGGFTFRVLAVDGPTDSYGQSITSAKRSVPGSLSFEAVPLTGGGITLP
ncbi:Ig-like domain-containing protein [Agromyces sp. GXQ0307]|uniref:Ig-like domain-containing protein n=1 Tax=Agromyces sp. GXQ0307 TaxID=3377835 RepID=UPI003839F1C3